MEKMRLQYILKNNLLSTIEIPERGQKGMK